MQCQEQFDLVIMDVFFDDIIPDEFESDNFLNSLKNITKPNGLLMYNRLAFTEKDIRNTEAFYKKRFSKIFDQGTYLEVKGNWMLLNRKNVLK